MRRPTLSRIPAIAILTIALAACGSTEPLPSATPAASAGGPRGSASTDATASGLVEFETRLRDATAGEGALVRELAAASAGSPDALRLVAGKMRAWADAERRWLAEHPADPCYDAAATKLGAAIDSIASSADWVRAMVDASLAPSDDVSRGSMGTEAGNDLQDATQALIDAAALAKAARPTCR